MGREEVLLRAVEVLRLSPGARSEVEVRSVDDGRGAVREECDLVRVEAGCDRDDGVPCDLLPLFMASFPLMEYWQRLPCSDQIRQEVFVQGLQRRHLPCPRWQQLRQQRLVERKSL